MCGESIRWRAGAPPEVVDAAGDPVVLRPTVARLLAVLAARAGDDVHADDIVAGVWDGAAPAQHAASLHTTVARLRRALPAGSVERTATGYRLTLRPGSAPWPAPPSPRRPFVGRGALVGEVCGTVAAGTACLVVGDAGTGRTRVLEEVIAAVAGDGRPAALVRCHDGGRDVPFGPLAPLLAGHPPPVGTALLDAVETELRERIGAERLVLGVDDVDHADALTAEVLERLRASGHVVPVATATRADHIPGAWRRLALTELTADDVAAWFAAAADEVPPADPAVTGDPGTWWALTGGNAAFLAAALTGDTSGAGLVAVIATQLAHLPPELHDALTVAAVAGPIRRDLIVGIAGEAPVRELEHRALVETTIAPTGRVLAVRHPLHARHLLQHGSRLLLRSIRRRLAAALAASDARDVGDDARIAGWLLAAGGELEPGLATTAAAEALAAGDADLAWRIAGPRWRDGSELALLAAAAGEHVAPAAEVLAIVDDERRRQSGATLAGVGARVAMWKLGDAGRAAAYGPVPDWPGDRPAWWLRSARPGEVPDAAPPFLRAVHLAESAEHALLAGRAGDAGRDAAVAARQLAATGHAPLAGWAWQVAGRAAALGGHADAAATAAAHRDPAIAWRSSGWVLLDAARAQQRADRPAAVRALRIAESAGPTSVADQLDVALACFELAVLGEPVGGIADERGEGVAALLLDAAAGITAGDHDAVARAAQALEAVGLHAVASTAFGVAAELAAAAGTPRAARRWRERSDELATGCDPGTCRVPLVASPAVTPREREIVELVAAGRSNDDVAVLLGISARTVANHLLHVYPKLGVASRRELAGLLQRR